MELETQGIDDIVHNVGNFNSEDQQDHSGPRHTIRSPLRYGFNNLMLYAFTTISKTLIEVNQLVTLLRKEFDIKVLGMPKKFLGLEICKYRAMGKLWLSQSSFMEKVLERINKVNAKLVTSTPLANHFKLSTAQCPRTNDEVRDMSRSLYQQQRDLSVVRFVDVDYVKDLGDRRSTTGYVVEDPIYWKSRVQSQVAIFTIESGYMTVAEATTDKFKHFLDLLYVFNF
ncbi:uncharacterized protein LOC131145848 [Malania oleifera]|uniref:uncharacterized protein LOC131145848 n=1 Tax=Malania oleifera TaxID=397392 RepID=UPI0025ADFF1D|nr:uncharacterized protein LOC131145848 [Malania oleifera]